MARRPTIKEIRDLIESMGGRKVTEEDKKDPSYKADFAWPTCARKVPSKKAKTYRTKKQPVKAV